MNSIMLALRQVRYENSAFWRNPAAAFFTIAFPLMFLVIFNLIFGNREVTDENGNTYSLSTFYVPGIMVFALVGATYTNVAMGIAFARDGGLLKRVRGTPLPSWSYLMGKIIHSVLLTALLVVIVTGAGWLAFGVDIPTNTLAAFLLTLAVAAATFCTLGLAVTSLIPNADAAPAIVNASILPLLFISDVFIRLDDAPTWLTSFADVFPVRHAALALQTSFSPSETGAGFEWGAPAGHGRVDGWRPVAHRPILPVGAAPVTAAAANARTSRKRKSDRRDAWPTCAFCPLHRSPDSGGCSPPSGPLPSLRGVTRRSSTPWNLRAPLGPGQ